MACLYIHVLYEASPNALQKTRIEDTPRVCSTHVTHLTYSAFCMKIGDIRIEPNTPDCVRRRMLPPALGDLRFRVPPVPEHLGFREYVKDQCPAHGPKPPPNTANYTKTAAQESSAAVCHVYTAGEQLQKVCQIRRRLRWLYR